MQNLRTRKRTKIGASQALVILRTEKSEKILDGAVEAGKLRTRAVDEEPFALTLLTKLSKKKRRNSLRS